jgi:hypothetical protein
VHSALDAVDAAVFVSDVYQQIVCKSPQNESPSPVAAPVAKIKIQDHRVLELRRAVFILCSSLLLVSSPASIDRPVMLF